ncbi:DUF2502 domain-containing protein [Erwiniaceae bacterium BAC15a-03b]|uniref:DUF2502 domain-containing protein n=1 Tax=Winslowiella arboricola TaxID=2978220 RepID=A0A9J6PT93_9GAMM|nr:DUF2502 domain-containing protein [Winslowiella arboricola]MCU5774930.1 DUF2502 domain-containing protein [Winslowiella arboricola]MCU5779918.1 DUF2502 domain-containing protein [Winslowiella arboricola]
MKKTAMLLCVLSGMPLLAQAGVSININTPGVSVSIGDRNDRGDYWDGYDWREPSWWKSHHGRRVGERGPRGDYWNGNGWQKHAPKQHAAKPEPQPQRQPQHQQAAQHDNGHGKSQQGGGQKAQGNGKGDNQQPVPPQDQHR